MMATTSGSHIGAAAAGHSSSTPLTTATTASTVASFQQPFASPFPAPSSSSSLSSHHRITRGDGGMYHNKSPSDHHHHHEGGDEGGDNITTNTNTPHPTTTTTTTTTTTGIDDGSLSGGGGGAGAGFEGIKSPVLEVIKEWTTATFKYSKQKVNERVVKGYPRTVDPALEGHIERVRETKAKYGQMVSLIGEMTSSFSGLLSSSSSLSQLLSEMSLKEPDPGLRGDLISNASQLKVMGVEGEKVTRGLTFLSSNLTTLVAKTMEDSLVTCRALESARVAFDGERNATTSGLSSSSSSSSYNNNFTTSTSTPLPSPTPIATSPSSSLCPPYPAPSVLPVLSGRLEEKRKKYETLRSDVSIKLKFLEENRIKVMRKQLTLMQGLVSCLVDGGGGGGGYGSERDRMASSGGGGGGNSRLDSTLKQFSVRGTTSTSMSMSTLGGREGGGGGGINK